jgi:UDP:flavonoid glycosyltransferase YjiC (YdhE family)
MVLAGQGQDKNVTNTIVEWKELGINLGRMNPSVGEIRDGVAKVLDLAKYKRNAVAMSGKFRRYDVGRVFDGVVQSEVRNWRRRAWKRGNRLGKGGGGVVET